MQRGAADAVEEADGRHPLGALDQQEALRQPPVLVREEHVDVLVLRHVAQPVEPACGEPRDHRVVAGGEECGDQALVDGEGRARQGHETEERVPPRSAVLPAAVGDGARRDAEREEVTDQDEAVGSRGGDRSPVDP